MINRESEPKNFLKGCYKTDEWSENSGICRRCSLKEECGKNSKTGKSKK